MVSDIITFKPDAAFNFEEALAAQGMAVRVSSFHGYRQLDFKMEGGRGCTVVRPYVTAASHPFAWRGEFFGHEPQTDLALLQHGFHAVYVDAQNFSGHHQPWRYGKNYTHCWVRRD